MKRIYAFTDESGNYGFDFNKQDISSHFIVTAIIVEEEKLSKIQQEVEEVRVNFFQTGEIKSSSVGKNHERRRRILSQLIKSDFKIFTVVVDKRKLEAYQGLKYKKSFYKFINNLVHKELSRLKKCRDIVKLGTLGELDVFDYSEYKSLKKYFDE